MLQPWRFAQYFFSNDFEKISRQSHSYKLILYGIFIPLQALKFLSEFHPNRSKMREEIGMVISLKSIMNNEGYNAKARQIAKEVYQNIIPPVNVASSKKTR